jgi:hypothetical protein
VIYLNIKYKLYWINPWGGFIILSNRFSSVLGFWFFIMFLVTDGLSQKELRNILIIIMKTVVLEGFIDKIKLNQLHFQYYQQKTGIKKTRK